MNSKNVFLNVRFILIEMSSEGVKEDYENLKSYNFHSPNFKNKINSLLNNVMEIKGDGINCDISLNNSYIYINLDLLFTTRSLTPHDKNIVQKIINEVDTFSENNEDIAPFNNIKSPSIDTEDEGIIVLLKHPGDPSERFSKVTSHLENNNYDYRILSKNKTHHEFGAGGGFTDLLLFIIDSAASGAIWDLLKKILKQNLDSNEQYKTMSSRQFKKIRKNVSDMFRVDIERLILFDFHVRDSHTEMVFNIGEYYIYVKANKEQKITSYKVDEQKK